MYEKRDFVWDVTEKLISQINMFFSSSNVSRESRNILFLDRKICENICVTECCLKRKNGMVPEKKTSCYYTCKFLNWKTP